MIIALQTLIFFRQSLLTAINKLLSPYYKRLSLTFSGYDAEDEEEEEEVFSEYDEEKGVVFYPPMYVQRYAAVSDCLMDERWCGKLEKVVDLGYHDMSFIKYLKEVPGVHTILGVDIESIPLRCSSNLFRSDDYVPKRDHPLHVTLFQGNAADPDYRLIGSDAVIAIEMIEHMLPHDLDRLVHTVFGFVKPWIAIFTTPNADFNVLFKSLEKNGLRRWDHFFEWTREQFHDWCSNIVVRYPQFTVTCQGIGPGPADTQHYGCCSQLALFVNKQYAKQHDLNPNSLAIVSGVPSPHDTSDIIGWGSPLSVSESTLTPKENGESLTEFLQTESVHSCVTILIASPSFSFESLEYRDKMSQCNLDTETGKNFLMFNDEEMCFSIRKPRRKLDGKVYEIGDVFSRLNCTTFHATKFSKTTQNLMAKHRNDSLVYTREVVDKISNLTKMLSFKTEPAVSNNIWCNINWGENAPYWNQYYKIVREFSHPLEVKSDECRILELISDEVNRLVDVQYDSVGTTDLKVEIPIHHLMKVISHITHDVEKVKDLLAWNGYVVSNDMVIHSREVINDPSVPSCDGDELDTMSEFDTLTSFSDGSNLPDYYGRCLCHALYKKVQNLRLLLSADEDMNIELDRVVCRLMKLALRTSKGKQKPPPTRWMQCKMLDLLTLTEKAIIMKKSNTKESVSLLPIGDGRETKQRQKILQRIKKEDYHASRIVFKYQNLIEAIEKRQSYDPFAFGFEDELELQDEASEFFPEYDDNKTLKSRTQAWVDDDMLEEVAYPNHDQKSIFSDHSTSNGEARRNKRPKQIVKRKETERKMHKRSYSKLVNEKIKQVSKKRSKTNIVKKVTKTTSTPFTKPSGKKMSDENIGSKSKKTTKEQKKIQSNQCRLSKHELKMERKPKRSTQKDKKNQGANENKQNVEVSATEESVLINIVMDDREETIALRRSIGIDVDMPCLTFDERLNVGNKGDAKKDKHQSISENVQCGTIFINDINEPSTSKGVRHISMDVQCGPDLATPACGLMSPPASITRIPKIFSYGIKIGDSLTNMLSKRNSLDFESSMNNNIENFGPVCSRIRPPILAKGIKIEDSLDDLVAKKKSFVFSPGTFSVDKESGIERRPTLRPTRIRIKDSLSEVRGKKSPEFDMSTNETMSKKKSLSVMTDTLRESVARMRSPTKRSYGIKIKDSTSDLQPGEHTNIDPLLSNDDSEGSRPKIPHISREDKVNHISCTGNLLKNNNNRIDNRFAVYRVNSARNLKIKKKTDLPLTNEDSLENTVVHSETKLASIFMGNNTTDYIADVSEETAMYDAPQCCKLVSPRVNSHKTFKSKLLTSDFGTCTYDNEEQVSQHTKESNNITNPFCSNERKYNMFQVTSESKAEYRDIDCMINRKSITSLTDITKEFVNNTNTCCDENQCSHKVLPVNNLGLKVKTTNANVTKKVEFATIRVKLISGCQPIETPSHVGSESLKTELLRPVSSQIKIGDSSVSDYSTSQKSFSNVVNSFSNTTGCNQSNFRDLMIKNHISPTKIMERRLSCGGVHVHSYKEKCSTEDIIFQGEWQRQTFRNETKPAQNQQKTPMKRAYSKKWVPKEKTQRKQPEMKGEVSVEQEKPVHVRNTKSIKMKQETINRTEQLRKVALPTLTRAIKANNKSMTKIASKVGMNSITSKNARSTRSAMRPLNALPHTVKKDTDVKFESKKVTIKKDYLPSYLKRRKMILEQRTLNDSQLSARTQTITNCNENLDLSHTEEIKTDLIKIQNEPRDDISYIVFRNELENFNKSSNDNQTESVGNMNMTESINRKITLLKRSSSPISHNSATCCTSQSVETIKTTSSWSKESKGPTRRHSTSSNKSSIGNTGSERTSPVRNRKFSKRSKTQKRSDDQDKENIPESSKKCHPEKGIFQTVKNAFQSRNKKIYVAQFATDGGLAQTPPKSNIKIPAVGSSEEIKRPKSAVMLNRKSLQSDDSSCNEDIKCQDSITSVGSNKVLLLKPYETTQNKTSSQAIPEDSARSAKVIDSGLLTEWLGSHIDNEVPRERTEYAILDVMRQIVEERLDFISNLSNDVIIDSTNLNWEETRDLDDNTSVKSFKTVVPINESDFGTMLKNEEDNLNHANDLKLGYGNKTGTELDLLSLQSVTSTSRYSEYFSAENEQIVPDELLAQTHDATSVHEIFERKDLNPIQSPDITLTADTFSGFSMNVEPVVGDQPDYVNLVDSETGSVALEMARQVAATEELFVYGRSSAVLDDDVVVPNWLFHIISQQDIAVNEERNGQELVPIPLPLVEPTFDVNGNVVEPGVGMGAGAGDGRGMHSDYSQDSSGRGSSLSSSDTSSGQQSEAILIDPSAFTQFELVRESIGSSMGVTTLVVPVESQDGTVSLEENEEFVGTSHAGATRFDNRLLLTSDGDADVSSLDTDLPDSSDN